MLFKYTGELSCREEGDEYNIVWPATTANTNVTLSCPSGTGIHKLDYLITYIYSQEMPHDFVTVLVIGSHPK